MNTNGKIALAAAAVAALGFLTLGSAQQKDKLVGLVTAYSPERKCLEAGRVKFRDPASVTLDGIEPGQDRLFVRIAVHATNAYGASTPGKITCDFLDDGIHVTVE